jgi:hypothetical protein
MNLRGRFVGHRLPIERTRTVTLVVKTSMSENVFPETLSQPSPVLFASVLLYVSTWMLDTRMPLAMVTPTAGLPARRFSVNKPTHGHHTSHHRTDGLEGKHSKL